MGAAARLAERIGGAFGAWCIVVQSMIVAAANLLRAAVCHFSMRSATIAPRIGHMRCCIDPTVARLPKTFVGGGMVATHVAADIDNPHLRLL